MSESNASALLSATSAALRWVFNVAAAPAKWIAMRFIGRRHLRLHLLEDEKTALRIFVVEGQRTARFHQADGVSAYLKRLGILEIANPEPRAGTIEYAIAPWALSYLASRPHLLTPRTPTR